MDRHATLKTLEAELKLLRWHKLANESALKAAVLKDKQIKRNDMVPRLLNGSRMRLNQVIEDERSKDLITDEAFVKMQQEYERKDEEAARRQMLIETKRLRAMQTKAENIRMSRTRKQKCLQIEACSAQHDTECSSAGEQSDGMENDATTTSHALVRFKVQDNEPQNQSSEDELAMLKRSQSCPAGAMTSYLPQQTSAGTIKSYLQRSTAAAVGEHRTKLSFTRLQSRSGPGEPSRPYYCVRASLCETDVRE